MLLADVLITLYRLANVLDVTNLVSPYPWVYWSKLSTKYEAFVKALKLVDNNHAWHMAELR